MKVTILQRDICWGSPAQNVARAEEALARLEPADLYVFPEMFSTGFCTAPEGMAEPLPSHTLEWMKQTAAAKDAALAGSIAVHDGTHYYNRFYFVHPDGLVQYYDKKHLFTYGSEHTHFTAGNERVIVHFRGVRFLLQVCYDLRFPVWARNTGDYDVILYVASWPIPRIEAWSTLLKARAIENQCYVIGVNRVGTDPSCEYNGRSVIIDPYGKPVVTCPEGEETEATAELDMQALADFRQKFPVLNDADAFRLD